VADRFTLPDLAGVEVEILPRPDGHRPDGRVDVAAEDDGDKLTVYGAPHVGAVMTIELAHGATATVCLSPEQIHQVIGALWTASHD